MTLSYQVVSYFVCLCVLKCICRFEIHQPIEYTSSSCTKNFNFVVGGGGRLPNKVRYGCATSAKPRPGKISPKNLMPGQKSAQKPNDWARFLDFRVPKLKIFSK